MSGRTSEPAGYTQEFWARAEQLAAKWPKVCEECGRTHDNKETFTVRVALRVANHLVPSNLGLFCTECGRGMRPVSVSRAKLAAQAKELPFADDDSHPAATE